MKDNEKRLWIQTLWNPANDKHQSRMESNEPGIRVAAYCRVSTQEDIQLKSLENQVSHYTHYIRSKPNWRFVGIYFDDRSTGAVTSKRRGFQRLIRHAEEGKVDLILTKNISRFARNSTDLISIVEKLKQIGVGIYFEKEKIDTSKEYNKFLLSTYAAIAQEEIESISKSIMWGYEKKFMRGKPQFHRMLGYRMVGSGEDQGLEIIEKEAEIVRRIFSLNLEGLTYAAIARYLRGKGLKTTKGKTVWCARSIKIILTNVTYTGNILTSEKQRDLFTRKIEYGKRDQVFIENTHSPIISIEEFNQVQRNIEEMTRDHRPPIPKDFNPLSRRLICGRCGYMLSATYRKDFQHYRCQARVMKLCDSITYTKPMIREMMLKAMQMKYDFSNEKVITELVKELQVMNQNDHFEFHRLRWITEIEIVKRKLVLEEISETEINIESIEKEYREFEARIAKIEDDREIRISAVSWVKDHRTIDAWLSGVTSEIMRAWIMELKIYTPDDYLVQWIDGSQTKIGDYNRYEDRNMKNEEPEAREVESYCLELPSEKREGNDTEELNLIKKEKIFREQIPKGKDDIYLRHSTQANVIKIETGQKNYLMKSLNKSLNANYLLRDPTSQFPKIDKPKLRTAAYCRISTDSEEQMVSLKTQVAYYTYVILKNPQYEYAGIYADEGISGKSMKNRKEFLKLLDECKSGNVDLILTKSISRFSRNSLDCLEQVRMLKNLPKPVFVIFEKESICTKDEKSDLMISIFGSIAQEESINTGEAMAWGKRRYAERGIVKPNIYPYGYRSGKNGEWEVVEEEATVVRRIFLDTIEGKSLNNITKELNYDGVKTSTGKGQWWRKTVEKILKSENYRGNYLYQKTYMKDTLSNKQVRNNGALPQFLIEKHHKAIVDRDDWERAQEIIEERSEKFANRSSIKYPEDKSKNKSFMGVMRCEVCGSSVGYTRKTINSVEIPEWRCKKAKIATRKDQCDALRLNQKYLEQHFMKTLLNIRAMKSLFKEKVAQHINSLALTSEEKIDKLEVLSMIDRLNQSLYKAVDQELNKKGQDSRKVDELTEHIVNLQNKLKEYTDREAKVVELDQELTWFMKAIDIVKEESVHRPEGLDPENKMYFEKDIYERCIKEARVHSDGRVVYKLHLGVEWSIDYAYEEFQAAIIDRRTDIKETEKLDFLNGTEVKDMLRWCSEPKKFSELYAFMAERKKVSIIYFRISIIKPLLEKGKIKYTITDDPVDKDQKYISDDGFTE